MSAAPTLHASAVLVGARAVVIRGPSGSGKSRLVWSLLTAARAGVLPFSRLVGDDRLHAEPMHGRLLVRPAPALAGRLEVRGVGILRLDHEPVAVAGWLIDLAAADADRFPAKHAHYAAMAGVTLPRLAVAAGMDPLAAALAFLTGTTECDR